MTINYELESFKDYNPHVADKVVSWYHSGRCEITIKLNDGTYMIYQEIGNRTRRMPPLTNPDGPMTEEEMRKWFSVRLEDRLYERGMTQKELAEKSDVPYRTINAYINQQRTPSMVNLYRIAHALNCDMNDLALRIE